MQSKDSNIFSEYLNSKQNELDSLVPEKGKAQVAYKKNSNNTNRTVKSNSKTNIITNLNKLVKSIENYLIRQKFHLLLNRNPDKPELTNLKVKIIPLKDDNNIEHPCIGPKLSKQSRRKSFSSIDSNTMLSRSFNLEEIKQLEQLHMDNLRNNLEDNKSRSLTRLKKKSKLKNPSEFLISIVKKKLRKIFKMMKFSIINSKNKKKLNEFQYKLLYLFTQLAVARSKIKKAESSSNKDKENLIKKIHNLEKKIYKLESNLSDKTDILTEKNETIIKLTEDINRMEELLNKLEKKKQQLDIIYESICSQCQSSIEESQLDLSNKNSNIESDLRKTIADQQAIIKKLEEENKSLRKRKNGYKLKNENLQKEYKSIKKYDILAKNFSSNNSHISNTSEKGIQVSEFNINSPHNDKNENDPLLIKINSNNELKNLNSELSDNIDNKSDNDKKSDKNINKTLESELKSKTKEISMMKSSLADISDKNSKMINEVRDLKLKLFKKNEHCISMRKENEALKTKYKSNSPDIPHDFKQYDEDIQDDEHEYPNSNRKTKNPSHNLSYEERNSRRILPQTDTIHYKKFDMKSYSSDMKEIYTKHLQLENEIKAIQLYNKQISNSLKENELIILSKDKQIVKLADQIQYFVKICDRQGKELENLKSECREFKSKIKTLERDFTKTRK